jgi:seryl-tRNA synthetase
MINVKDLVQNKDKYLDGFKKKGMDLEKEVNQVIDLQNKLSPLLTKETEIRAELNSVSKEISKDHTNQELKEKAGKLSAEAKQTTSEIKELQEEIKNIASHFPQLPMEEVIVGKDENDNVVIAEFADNKDKDSLPH